jgi:hypothetical protein
MSQIFQGDGATECDGSISGYSSLMHILSEDSKKATAETTLPDLVLKGFDYNLEVDYSF